MCIASSPYCHVSFLLPFLKGSSMCNHNVVNSKPAIQFMDPSYTYTYEAFRGVVKLLNIFNRKWFQTIPLGAPRSLALHHFSSRGFGRPPSGKATPKRPPRLRRPKLQRLQRCRETQRTLVLKVTSTLDQVLLLMNQSWFAWLFNSIGGL